ncbi:LL-diaminopimelate aminotransferase [Thalassobacillus cyri]|uniref:Aminotransferase n=1 Tax=Thalassobacillus cyri TaxID=571932 RepID=A0A1H3X7C0_9BACI|nr:LL-diaminopimelate aminotransferase [Thalassobacillus cyri]SDZ94524.1 LL-diaminopimelate aminotransferase [Thalassobacillus cyri]
MPPIADRVTSLPPYLFSIFQQKKKELEARGVDVIDLGIGAPDLPTPSFIINRLVAEVQKPDNHIYSSYNGCKEFRQAVADFYKKTYHVELDPDTEVLALIGSKEGIAHMAMTVLNPGDTALIPDPGYPVYRSAVHLAGGKPAYLPLDANNGYQPEFHKVPADVRDAASVMFLNYPSNPTAATVDVSTFDQAIDFARKHKLAFLHDAAYSAVTFDGYQAPSVLQSRGAKEVAVEFGSLSKSFNMTGWRIGYVVGNKELVKALSIVKSNTDTSQFLPIQKAGATALRSDFSAVKENVSIYEKRMTIMLDALRNIGIEVSKPKGTFFIWAPVPEGFTSASFVEKVLEEAGVILTPGIAFGPSGDNYFRISLSVDTKRLQEAADRMKVWNPKES